MARLLLVVLDAADSHILRDNHVHAMGILLTRDCSSDHEHRDYSQPG